MRRSDRNPISTHNGYVKLKYGLFNQILFEIPDSEFTFLNTNNIADYEFQANAWVYRQIPQEIEEETRETVPTENMSTEQLIEYFDRISQDE